MQQTVTGRMTENLLGFVRLLRAAGLPAGSGEALLAFEALAAGTLGDRESCRTALAAVLVKRPRERAVFERAFELYFGRLQTLADIAPEPAIPQAAAAEGAARPERIARLLVPALDGEAPLPGAAGEDRGAAAAWSASRREHLRRKDFDRMSEEELAAVHALMRERTLTLLTRTRRFRPAPRGVRPDLRASVRRSLRHGGELFDIAWRRAARRPRPLVLIADVSGSMSRYTRMFVLFAGALTAAGRPVETFLFGTRLTRITRRLSPVNGKSDPDRALARVAAAVEDWGGGTRIAESLEVFNRRWARRVLARNAIVVLLTDGLERRPGAALGQAMRRLRRNCRRLVWLNPMLRYSEYAPLTRGVGMMLPHVDDFLPAHNLASLEALAGLLDAPPAPGRRAA